MNILLVGGGWIAETVYVPFLSEIEEIEHIYIADVDAANLKNKFCGYQKVEIVSSINNDEITYDAACILTPNYLHEEEISLLSKKNIKILIEKPICITTRQVQRLEAMLCKNSFSIFVSAPLRYRNDLCIIKEQSLHEIVGDVYHVEMSWLKRKGIPGSSWFTNKKLSGGGVLMDMGPHLLDIYYWIFGQRQLKNCLSSSSSLFINRDDVYADWHLGMRERNKDNDVEDSSFSFLQFNTTSLMLNLAWVCNIPNDYAQLTIFGTKARINVFTSLGFSTNTLYKDTQINITTKDETKTTEMAIEDRKEPFRKMLNDFILNDKCNLPDAKLALRVISDISKLYATN